MKELISIVIPVHNSSKYLKMCLESILNQTYKNIEIIAVENGSSDNSLKILNTFKDRIKIEVLQEKGLSKARNRGIEISTGKYIAFVDSDDTIEINFIEELFNHLKKNDSDISLCDIKEMYESTNKIILRNEFPKKNIKKDQILKNLDKFSYGPCNKLYKKDIITNNNIKFPNNLKYEDIPFVLSYLINCNNISKVNEYLYNYNIHEDSEQTTIDNRIMDIIEIMNSCLNIISKEQLKNFYIKTLTTYALKVRYSKDSKLRNNFIEQAYKELNKNYPNWKKSEYMRSRNILKRIIQNNKNIVKIYAKIYQIFH